MAAYEGHVAVVPRLIEREACPRLVTAVEYAQLRVMMRRWRQRASIGVGLAALSGLGVLACWWLSAHGVWWFLSITALGSALIEVLADINAYCDTKKRVSELEG